MAVDAGAWTTLAAVKEHLQIASATTTFDAWLESLINRSYKILEKYIGRVIKEATYTEYYDGDGTPDLLVYQWPINSVTSLHDDVERAFNADSLIAADDYVIYAQEGLIRLLNATGEIPLFNEGVIFTRGVQNLKVVYVAGYSTIPADLAMASIHHVSFMYNKGGAEGHRTMSLGGLAKSYDPLPIPAEVKFMLEPYRKRAS